jgi:hypothetical protein
VEPVGIPSKNKFINPFLQVTPTECQELSAMNVGDLTPINPAKSNCKNPSAEMKK